MGRLMGKGIEGGDRGGGGRSLLEKYLGKLPLTKKYIESVQEDCTDYHIRKIK